MKLNELEAGHYLESDVQLVVPPYQRPYEWTVERWTDLWRDLAHQYHQLTTKNMAPAHFMGALILETREPPAGSTVHSYSAIDGQQRLLTLFICLAAFRDHTASLDRIKVTARNELNTITPKYGGKPCARLTVRPMNQPAMDAILRGDCKSEIPETHVKSPLMQAYRFFRWQLWNGETSLSSTRVSEPPRPKRGKNAPPAGSFEPWGAPARGAKRVKTDVFHRVIVQGLKFIEIVLETNDEESSVVFETMNSKSTPLRQFDLLRNSVFVRMPNRREKFYATHWQPVEEMLSTVSYSSLRAEPEEQFLYEYMIAQGEDKVSRDSLHRRWTNRAIEVVGYAVTDKSQVDFEKKIATPFCESAALYPLAVGQKQSVNLLGRSWAVTDDAHQTIREIMAMSGGPLVPLVLQVLTDRHADGSALTDNDVEKMLGQIQSFLVRMILSGQSLSPLRATGMAAAAAIDRPTNSTKLSAALKDAGWRTDKQVMDVVREVQLDVPGSVMMPILRGIEKQFSGAGAHPMPFGPGTNQYSLEHIYPQTDAIGALWEAELAKWKADREEMDQRRYTLGNFTAVTNYDNKKNGRKPFASKKPLIVACAPLRLHDSIKAARSWKPAVIDARSALLAEAALKRWPRA